MLPSVLVLAHSNRSYPIGIYLCFSLSEMGANMVFPAKQAEAQLAITDTIPTTMVDKNTEPKPNDPRDQKGSNKKK